MEALERAINENEIETISDFDLFCQKLSQETVIKKKRGRKKKNTEANDNNNAESEKKKRGRKKKEDSVEESDKTKKVKQKKNKSEETNDEKRSGYFYEEQEEAFVKYLTTDSAIEKEKIFNNILYPAFVKMTEAIIRRYKLFPPDEEFEDTFNDAMSFLMTKIDRFKIDSSFKAYSYCGTILKNYLIYRVNCMIKMKKKVESFDLIKQDIFESEKYIDDDKINAKVLNDFLNEVKVKIQEMIDNPTEYDLDDTNLIVGNALLTILNEWDSLSLVEGSNKYNKSSVILMLKEYTGLPYKDVRDNLKKFKDAYLLIRQNIFQED